MNTTRKQPIAVILIIFFALVVSACGQKGDLYLPEPPQTEQQDPEQQDLKQQTPKQQDQADN